jgi:aminoglycoside N3'-acetyltransferase
MGIAAGDTVLLHSAYRSTNGFRGTPSDVIGVLRDLIGESGTLAMMSMPYTTSTKEYLASGPVFDVRRTPSHMGIITEIFRRSGAMRSLSPTHPILAAGAGAESYLAHHSECRYPCGPGSPFERMLHANAKVLFFDLPFVAFTFFHYIEHRLQDRLPFPLYEEAPMIARYLDYDGRAREAEVFVFTDEAIKRRRVAVIAGGTRRTGKSSWSRIGNTRLVLTTMADALDTTLRLADAGTLPYERSG